MIADIIFCIFIFISVFFTIVNTVDAGVTYEDGKIIDVHIRDTDDVVKVFVPVRHGRWIDKGEYAVCTECGGRSGTQYDGVELIPLMTQFCPFCGAIMDGGAE